MRFWEARDGEFASCPSGLRDERRGGGVRFDRYEAWPYAAPGQPVIGVAVGRVRGISGLLLFVLKSMAWGKGSTPTAPVLQVFSVR